jgi:hypothetical protein
VYVGAARTCAWLGGPVARECQQDDHSCVDMQGGEM